MTKYFIQQKNDGQNVFEYTVIPCLLLVLSLGSFVLLGGDFNNLALNAKKTMQDKIKTNDETRKTLAQTALTTPQVLTTPEDILTQVSGDLPDASGPTSNLAGTVTTLGANGAINSMAQEISVLASQLLIQIN
jgi:hypothetical protein